jgi:hypothetical protein
MIEKFPDKKEKQKTNRHLVVVKINKENLAHKAYFV